MSFIVNEIVNRKGMNDFLSLPMEIYKNDPNWICPQRSETLRVLDPVKNPYLKQALLKVYVCYYCNKPVSRAVMVVNHLYWQRWNKKSAFFGFFESLYDPGAVKCLFNKIIEPLLILLRSVSSVFNKNKGLVLNCLSQRLLNNTCLCVGL